MANLVLIAWIPALLVLFVVLPPRRAAIASFLIAWMFLPVTAIGLPGLPDYDKMFATSVGVLLGLVVFDPGKMLALRFRWFDIPMTIWCLAPFFASISNGLGPYDGVSASMNTFVQWGLPYIIGRAYLDSPEAMRELAIAIVLGTIVYVPLCLFELRFSPQLHRIAYGFHQHSFAQHMRDGGYRPMVFMQHGLMVSAFLASGCILATWLWLSNCKRQLLSVPMWVWSGILFLVLVLTKSKGALVLTLLALAIAAVIYKWRKPWPAVLLIALPIGYMSVRATNIWSGAGAFELITVVIDEYRAQSFQVRLDNENMLTDRALERPIFGWGGWSRSRVLDEYGNDISVTDGLWVIALGKTGLVGLCSLTAAILLPLTMLIWRTRRLGKLWFHPTIAPASMLAVLLGVYMLDNIPNAMVNPIYVLAAGPVCMLMDRKFQLVDKAQPRATYVSREPEQTTPRQPTTPATGRA